MPERNVHGKLVRFLFMAAGTIFLTLGLIGVAVPLMPTTPFLILAAACYARGSARMHRWLLTNKIFGKVVSDYTQRRGITPRARWSAVGVLWITIAASVLLVARSPVVLVLLLLIATGVTLHLLTLRTIRDASDKSGE